MKLLLYKYISPNNNDNAHFVFDTPLQYISAFQGNLCKEVEIDNYRINANVIKVSLNGTIADDYEAITYAIEYDEATNFMRCFFVEDFNAQSGFVTFNCKIDYWGTYISKASMYDFVVTRCNRNIGLGVYDDITATNGEMQSTEAWQQSGATGWGGILDTNVCIVFLLQYNFAQTTFGNERISKTEMFCLKLSDLKAKAVEIDANFNNFSSAEIAIDIVGGIYGCSALGIDPTNDAQVLKAWLCHYDFIDTGRQSAIEHGIKVKSKSSFTKGKDIEMEAMHVYPSRLAKKITIENYDINKIYYAGTFNNGLKLQRFTSKDLTYYTYYIVSDDEVKVIVQQGEYQKDISNAYEVLLTTNGATQTGIRKVANVLAGSIKTFTSASKAFEKGGAVMAGLTATETLAGMLTGEGYESAIGGGDGFTTFYQDQFNVYRKGKLKTPYVLTTFASVMDEKKNARRFGASFKCYYEQKPFKQIATDYAFLGDEVQGSDNATFIACNCLIYNIPMVAKNEILGKLKGGIYYHCLN